MKSPNPRPATDPRHADATPVPTVSIRAATLSDQAAIERLAGLDSARPPREPALVAELEGEILAAISVADGRGVADPFRRTAELVALLELRAAQAREARRRPLRIVARTFADGTRRREALRERPA